MHLAVLLPLVVLPFSLAAQAKVKVGNAKGELVFDRPNVVAGKGDTIEFTFYPMNHSVAQSTFDKPCEPLDNGIFSGFFPVKDGTAKQVFTVTVNDTNPIWIYCSQGNHCQEGMAMVINAPQGKSISDYQKNAQTVAQSGSQTEVRGGVVSNASGSGNASASGSSSASAGTASTTATAASNSATSSTTATGTGTGASNSPNAVGKVSAGAGLGALGLLGVLVGGMV